MSAKINIETDDPALATALGMVVARAIEDAGFSNAKAKVVMVMHMLHIDNDSVSSASKEISREPPILRPLKYVAYPDNAEVIRTIAQRNPGLMNKPILLSFHPDTSEKYEADARHFLTSSTQDPDA